MVIYSKFFECDILKFYSEKQNGERDIVICFHSKNCVKVFLEKILTRTLLIFNKVCEILIITKFYINIKIKYFNVTLV